MSRLPANPLGWIVHHKDREVGADTSHIVWSTNDHLGLYLVEYAASSRASCVLYDRAHSAMSQIRPGEIDWPAVLRRARQVPVSGITPALSDDAAAVAAEALMAAKKAVAPVKGAGFDGVDFRSARAGLWSQDKP